MVFDNTVSFSCNIETQVEHLAEDLPREFIDEIGNVQQQLSYTEFTSREDLSIFPAQDNPYGLSISGEYVQNLRIIPIRDPILVYALVVLVNVSEDKLSDYRNNVKPFITATANLFSIKQIRNVLPRSSTDKSKQLNSQSFIADLLSNIYHPVVFFDKTHEISHYNRHSINLIQQSNMNDTKNMRDFVEHFMPTIAPDMLLAIENYEFNGKFNTREWIDIPFKLNAFQTVQVDLRLVPLASDEGKRKHASPEETNFALMINDNKRNELHSLQRFQALTSLIPLGILQMSLDFKCVYANDTWSKITSMTMTTSIENGWASCFNSADLHRILPEMKRLNLQNREYSEELRINTKLKGIKWVNLKSVGLFDDMGRLDGFIMTLDDVSKAYAQKQALEELANTDSLTGISNRSCFHDRLKVAITRVERHDNAAVLFIDLDKFKSINDTYGHSAGDLVIQKVAQRLHKVTRSEDTIARLGGDEFAVIVSDVRNDNDVINLAIKITIEVARPVYFDNTALKIQCSIGVAHVKSSRATIKSVLRHADLAVYKAKSLGRNQYCVYTESLERETLLANYLRTSLHENLATDFFLEYQPQVNSTTNRIVGVEVLSRWNHPKKQSVSPQEFILQLETSGLINEFFVWQLEFVLPIASKWIEQGLINADCRLSINLSAIQLHLNNFATQLLQAFDKYAVDPNCFGLEVTETAFVQDPISARKNLESMREAGFHIALDDFGTGFSSLNLLRKMPLDSIKIDKEFISDILNNSVDAKIVQSMITLSRELELTVVAEGVENDAVKLWLDDNDCPIQQGFHFYKPMPKENLEACLHKDAIYIST